MTIYDKIVNFDEEEMAEFLYRFSRDTINNFSNFQFPDKDSIRAFLQKKIE